MANWAIVIGIDEYWKPEVCLKGAVHDALKVRDWLLDDAGGAVPPRNLSLLLAPSPSSVVPRGLIPDSPTRDSIIAVADRLLRKSEGKGDRFFFHYSGHGFTAEVLGSSVNAIATKDYTDLLYDNSLSLSSIFEYFKATEFREQFFFIDACRNIPLGRPIPRTGALPAPRPSARLGEPAQFCLYATSDWQTAVEIHERGAFTEQLLNGLADRGRAKVFVPARGQHEVTVQSLFQYVQNEVKARKYRVIQYDKAAADLIQVPQGRGNLDANPTLARFKPAEFGDETLTVHVEPREMVSHVGVAITVRDEDDEETTRDELPLVFQLPPRKYRIRGKATGYRPSQRNSWIELYEPSEVIIAFEPAPAGPETEPPVPTASGSGESTRGLGSEGAARTAVLTVESTDALAPLELLDALGTVVDRQSGKLVRLDLEPGLYRVRLRTPEGEAVEREVDLAAGDDERFTMQAPGPRAGLVSELVQRAAFTVRKDNTLEVAGTVGPMATASLSTILSLAGSVANEDLEWGNRLRKVGLRSFRDAAPGSATSGVQVLFGIESVRPGDAGDGDAGEYLRKMKLRVWPQNGPVPATADVPLEFSGIKGLAAFQQAAEPGSYWGSLESLGQPPVVFALAVLPERLTMLIVQRDTAGRMRVFQYHPALTPEERERRDQENAPIPGKTSDESAALRRRQVDLLQRFYLSGQLMQTEQNAVDLLMAKWDEPVAGCLGGYLLLRLGKPDRLGAAAYNLAGHFGNLSDSHVLMAEYQTSISNRDFALVEFGRALDWGLPLCADGLSRLLGAVRDHHLKHANVPLLEAVYQNRVPGLLWSAWVPREFTPGQHLST